MIKATFNLILVLTLTLVNLWVAANFGFVAGVVLLGVITAGNLVGQLNKK